MGTPLVNIHCQQFPASQTPGKIWHTSFGKAPFQLLQTMAQHQQKPQSPFIQEMPTAPPEHPWAPSRRPIPSHTPVLQLPLFKRPRGKGVGCPITIWFHLVKNGEQQGPATILHHTFALLEISDEEKFPAATGNSKGTQEHGVFTKEHLHLLAAELLKVVLLGWPHLTLKRDDKTQRNQPPNSYSLAE